MIHPTMLYENARRLEDELKTALSYFPNKDQEDQKTKVYCKIAELAHNEFLQNLLKVTALPADCIGRYIIPAYQSFTPNQRQEVLSLVDKLREDIE